MVHTEELKTDAQSAVRTALGRFARRGSAAALAVGMSLGALFMSTTPASAYVGENFLRNWETGRCLDADNTGSIYTLPCQQGNAYQTWEPIYIRHSTSDMVQVKNKATGRCLHVNGNGALTTYWCDLSGNPSANQSFLAVGSSWDQVELSNVLFRTCVDSNYAGAAYVTGCNGGGYQKWKLGF
ncbi:RICIN domain-containing protein [Streptomyces acidiscabies]|uniref:RICIN domain-containing protein n=1 Tax=Streptomyces acidiscabies TaxID=42234 RepID=A0AAP6EH26_9ACTN|nr:RICIN domain-containing protein [Streptomyces acidiscabies]MBP5942718.1 ricin-type beta-trefoil lectin domain protein [Streptomyces sp. LBUM 1476]MBZ3917940.1 ACP synthase [Streptomyces acidiscabies]MDX2961911.1 RICIN domain-containing protein [Streptomyces acidiscabies]MDX3021795.1 RICIN domain-containing protein [Streptomyces acidiscabies]MDX3789452.1 RICIN domain-containing protein [Streptomyces acidiscabies]